jgi:hypothetical protein
MFFQAVVIHRIGFHGRATTAVCLLAVDESDLSITTLKSCRVGVMIIGWGLINYRIVGFGKTHCCWISHKPKETFHAYLISD